MLCDRCGEIAETYMTEKYGELCEACQQEVQQENHQQFGRARPQRQEG